MKGFHAIVTLLLAAITFELGVLIMKLPDAAVQAQPRPYGSAPAPALQDPHDLIRADISQVRKEITTIQQQLGALRQQVTQMGQQDEQTGKIVYQSARVLTGTCTYAANLLRDLDYQRWRDLSNPNTRVNVCQAVP